MFKLWFFLLLILISSFSLNSEAKPKHINIVPKFFINILKNKADHILETVIENTQCAKDFKRLLNDAVHFKRWALEMLDSTAKVPHGLLAGNIYMHGNFEECVKINEIKENSTIRGQYCTVLLTPGVKYNGDLDFSNAGTLKEFFNIKTSSQMTEVLKNIKMMFGICIPHTCSIGHLQKLWDYVEHTFRIPIHTNFIDVMCSSRVKRVEPLGIDVFVLAFFGIYIAIVMLSTGYDYILCRNVEGVKDNIWITFSLYSNVQKFFKIADDPDGKFHLEAISGLKVLSMLWVIYGHRVLLNLFSGTINLIYLSEWKSEVFTAFNLSSTFSVDTFLLLSGLLLSYGILTHQNLSPGQNSVPAIQLYIYRILRLSPGLFAVILFNISILKNFNEGPIWPLVAVKSSRACLKTGFATLFFLNNYLDVDTQCIEQSWYLAVDSQLFFIGPLVINYLLKYPLKTCLSCIGVCILSGIYTFIITLRNNYGAIYFESNRTYLHYIYQQTLVRMPPWFIGIIYGYILFNYRNIKLSKIVNWLAWIAALSILMCLILVHLVFTKTNEYDALNAAIFNSSARQLWAFAVGLVLFLCSINRQGIINRFLSMSVFRILVRLSYSFYLTHGFVLLYFIGGKKHSTYFENMSNIHDFFGDILFAVPVAFIWCLVFESPFIAIAKHIYQKEMESLKQTNKLTQKRKKGSTKTKKSNYVLCVYKFGDDEKILSSKKDK